MTVSEYINLYGIDSLQVVAFIDWQVVVLYDSRKTEADIPSILADSVIETVTDNGKYTEIEIYSEAY